MKLYFYRGKYPNFGDDLNEWLLPKVFPDFFDDNEDDLFLGIGSILFDHHPANSRKIVFGSGYAGYTPLPAFDKNWTFYCVRGPKTAEICGLNPDKIAGDSAILINQYRKKSTSPSRRIAFIPHWQSLDVGHWQQACRLAGIYFIDPRNPVEDVLNDIESTSMVITEAMHGAIVADALRVPWVPILPIHKSHRFKWHDWAGALDLKLSPYRLWPSSMQEAAISIKQRNSYRLENPGKVLKISVHCADQVMTALAAARLTLLAKKEPVLSSDTAMTRATDKLLTYAGKIRKDFSS